MRTNFPIHGSLALAAFFLAACQPMQPGRDGATAGPILLALADPAHAAGAASTSGPANIGEGVQMLETNYPVAEPPFALAADVNAKFVPDIAYDRYDLTKFDFFKPASATPTPLVIYIHGGGFRGLDKDRVYEKQNDRDDINAFLARGIAFITINYRLLENENETAGVKKCLEDSKRALQAIRYHAADLNIDPERIVLWGSSAGAGTSLWLALNDDMADATNVDPILRESTRVLGVAGKIPQTTYDFDRWETDIYPDFNFTLEAAFARDPEGELEPRLLNFYAIESMDDYATTAIDDYREDVDMLDMVSSDDPELWLQSTSVPLGVPETEGALLHHPFFVRELVEATDAAGVATVFAWGYGNEINASERQEASRDFLIRKLTD